MSRFRKQDYKRQVSEDPDIDNLLANLSPEEMQELQVELEVMDPNSSVAIGLRQRNQTDKQSTGTYDREAMLTYCEKSTKKLIEREQSIDVSFFLMHINSVDIDYGVEYYNCILQCG